MADKTESMRDDSHYRVTLELARLIASEEGSTKKDRAYWLDLYHQCQRVVFGRKSAAEATGGAEAKSTVKPLRM